VVSEIKNCRATLRPQPAGLPLCSTGTKQTMHHAYSGRFCSSHAMKSQSRL
jgi:hypothetical protein